MLKGHFLNQQCFVCHVRNGVNQAAPTVNHEKNLSFRTLSGKLKMDESLCKSERNPFLGQISVK